MKKVISSFVLFFALSASVAFAQTATSTTATKSCTGGAAEGKSCCKGGAAATESKACCKGGEKASASAEGVSKEAQQVKYVSGSPTNEKKVVRRVSAKKASASKPASVSGK